MSNVTIDNHTTHLVTHECPVCGVVHAFPDKFDEQALKHSREAPGETRSIYCPNGHCWSYLGKNESQKLQERLDRERAKAARLAAERDQAEASARAYKGAATRARNRSKNGVCPCCNRTFKALARHMRSQHPDFDPAAT